MNEHYALRNRLTKSIAITASELLEHFQWGTQSAEDEKVLTSIEKLEKQLQELKASFRE